MYRVVIFVHVLVVIFVCSVMDFGSMDSELCTFDIIVLIYCYMLPFNESFDCKALSMRLSKMNT